MKEHRIKKISESFTQLSQASPRLSTNGVEYAEKMRKLEILRTRLEYKGISDLPLVSKEKVKFKIVNSDGYTIDLIVSDYVQRGFQNDLSSQSTLLESIKNPLDEIIVINTINPLLFKNVMEMYTTNSPSIVTKNNILDLWKLAEQLKHSHLKSLCILFVREMQKYELLSLYPLVNTDETKELKNLIIEIVRCDIHEILKKNNLDEIKQGLTFYREFFIESLTFDNFEITDEFLSILIEHCPKISSLSFDFCKFTNGLTRIPSSLKHLALNNCLQHGDLKCLKDSKIETLKFNSCFLPFDAYDNIKTCICLTTLELNVTNVFQGELNESSNLSSSTLLNNHYKNITDKLFELKILRIYDLTIQSVDFSHLKLKELLISGNSFKLEEIVKNKTLEILYIQNKYNFTVADIQLLESLPSLKVFDCTFSNLKSTKDKNLRKAVIKLKEINTTLEIKGF